MLTVDALGPDDRPVWIELFRAYHAFYGRPVVPDADLGWTWQEIQHGNRMHALGA